MTDWPESQVERVRQLLRAAVKESGSVIALEKKVGAAEGSLRRVLNGQVKLSLRYILLILDGLGMSWGEFFRAAFPEGEESLRGRPGGSRREHPVQEAPGASEDEGARELDRAVLLALLRLLEVREPVPGERAGKT